MRKNNNTIEINGKRYDATTGALLSPTDPSATSIKTQPTLKDHLPEPASEPTIHHVTRRRASKQAAHHPTRSRTLMRQAVQKPEPSLKRRHKAQGPANTLAHKPLAEVIVKPSASELDQQRLQRARHIPHNQLVSRFPSFTPSTAAFTAQRPAPAQATTRAIHSVKPAKRPQTTADLLDAAMQRANSHLQPAVPLPRKARRDRFKRNAGIGAAITLSVGVLGVIVVQNLTNVHLQMASAKAGFNVSLPGYRPAGYGLGQINYSEGVAAVQFSSHNDNHHYTLTQKSTSWDGTALRDNFVSPTYGQYQTVAANGLTIYLYGNHDATWVNNGIWYIIQSDGSLSNGQLVDLATSL